MNIKEILYVISISLQISGAGVISFYWFKNKDQIFQHEYNDGTSMLLMLEEGSDKIKLDNNKALQIYKSIWVNRMSFLSIALGLLVGVLGEAPQNEWISCFLCVITSIVFGVFVLLISNAKAKKDTGNEKHWHALVQDSIPEGTIVGVEIPVNINSNDNKDIH